MDHVRADQVVAKAVLDVARAAPGAAKAVARAVPVVVKVVPDVVRAAPGAAKAVARAAPVVVKVDPDAVKAHRATAKAARVASMVPRPVPRAARVEPKASARPVDRPRGIGRRPRGLIVHRAVPAPTDPDGPRVANVPRARVARP